MGLFSKKERNYVSEFDKFFHEFDQNRKLPASRVKEVKKYQAIYDKRDHAHEPEEAKIWDKF